jgi:hypothetical protein
MTTNASGVATIGSWVLGRTAGANSLLCNSGTLSTTVLATAVIGPPASMAVVAGNNQTATVGSAVAIPPAVVVRDAHGNPVAGIAVDCAVTAGGGAVTGGAQTTSGSGVATVGSWVLGTTAGTNTLTCSSGTLSPALVTATGAAGPPATVAVHAGQQQQSLAGTDVSIPPAVRVRDAHGNGVPGIGVNFAVAQGGGSVTGGSPTTDAGGIAAIGRWRLGTAPGPNTLVATVAGLAPVTFEAEATPVGFVVSVEAVQLNQGNQSLSGSIGGVAQRPGLLRVVVRANEPNTHAPPVRVRLYNGATLIREATIAAPQAGVPVNPDLNTANSTWNLPLTAAEVVAGLSVEAVVDPNNTIQTNLPGEKRFPRGSGTASLDVQPLHPLRVYFLQVVASVQGTTGNINAENVDSYLTSLRQWIPSGTVAPTIRTAPYTTTLDLSNGANWSTLLAEIQAVRTADGARDEYYHGIIGNFNNIPAGGLGYVLGSPNSSFRTAISYDRMPFAQTAVAHEIGHNMGRFHAPCGNPGNIDANYPYANAIIGTLGYNITTFGTRPPQQNFDFMAYCQPEWVSDYTFGALLQWRRTDPLAQPFPAAYAGSSGRENGVLVWGSISSRGVTLHPAFELVTRPVLPEAGGPNTVRGLAGDGRELFRLSFEGTPVGDSDDPDERHFVYFVPLSRSQLDAIERIELSTPQGAAVRTSPVATAAAGGAGATAGGGPGAGAQPARVQVQPVGSEELRVRWDAATHPMALIRDAATGEILSFGRGGDVPVALGSVRPERVEVLLSDGIRSRLAVPE